jgi:ribA/ribD-fused uncharacterized protein
MIIPEIISSFDNDFSFLSNFYPIKIEYYGLIYPSSECAYQASKILTIEEKEPFTKLKSNEAKKLGREIEESGRLRKDWRDVNLQIMKDILGIKFSIPLLKKMLLKTGDSMLIEGNYWHDNFWGNCYCDKCTAINGLNHLGISLMKIRGILKNEN